MVMSSHKIFIHFMQNLSEIPFEASLSCKKFIFTNKIFFQKFVYSFSDHSIRFLKIMTNVFHKAFWIFIRNFDTFYLQFLVASLILLINMCTWIWKSLTFEVSVLEIQWFFRSCVENIVFANFTVSDGGNLRLSNAADCNSIRPSVSVLWRCKTRGDIHIIWSWKLSFCHLKNFKAVFHKTLFFKSSI